ncbi:MAG: hypothetical protein AAF441_13780 [Pseudomonadota bacterium]
MDPATIIKVGGAIVVILLVIIIGLAIFRHIGGEVRGKRGSRLAVVEFQEVDKLRHLVLVRRDDAEHLLLIGGSQDVVVETNIGETTDGPVGVRRVPPPEAKVPPPAYDEYAMEPEEPVPTLGPAGPRPRR